MDSVGQLIILGISGTKLNDEEKAFIEKEHIGGIILFKHNYESPAQLAELSNSIQVLRNEYPLFISVDQEGGRVQRFKAPFTIIPPMYEVGLLNSPKICYEIHKIMAEELSVCGVNLNFSPCCDILRDHTSQAIGDRSFGRDAELVASHVTAAIRGLQTNGVLACAKHFPDHGLARKDSHFELPIIKEPLENLKTEALIPFIKASKARVEFMMMSHMMVDALDSKLPCSLSPVAHEYMRDILKFAKIIITDDLEMKAITDKTKIEDAAVMALDAGADMLLFRSFETGKRALAEIKRAMKEKKIKNSTIEDKLKRVEDCKMRNLANYEPIYVPSIQNKVNSASTQAYMKEIQKKIQELNLEKQALAR